MPTSLIFIPALTSFFVAFLATPFVKNLSLKYGIVDKPGGRKVHKGIVARGGGIAIYLGFMASLFFLDGAFREIQNFVFAATLIFILGLLDDKYSLKPSLKLLFQSAIAILIISSGVAIDINKMLGGRVSDFSYLSYPLTFLWIVGITNIFSL